MIKANTVYDILLQRQFLDHVPGQALERRRVCDVRCAASVFILIFSMLSVR